MLDNFVSRFSYRGKRVDVFMDEPGQQYYFVYKDKTVSCGAFNTDWKDVVKYTIDQDLDYILNMATVDERFYGAYVMYGNHKHTKVQLHFRGEVIAEFEVHNKNHMEIGAKCEKILHDLFENPEFIKSEIKRKESGNLYIHEMMEQDKESA